MKSPIPSPSNSIMSIDGTDDIIAITGDGRKMSRYFLVVNFLFESLDDEDFVGEQLTAEVLLDIGYFESEE